MFSRFMIGLEPTNTSGAPEYELSVKDVLPADEAGFGFDFGTARFVRRRLLYIESAMNVMSMALLNRHARAQPANTSSTHSLPVNLALMAILEMKKAVAAPNKTQVVMRRVSLCT